MSGLCLNLGDLIMGCEPQGVSESRGRAPYDTVIARGPTNALITSISIATPE